MCPVSTPVVATTAAEPPSLDIATHSVSAYPGCGEVVIQNVSDMRVETKEESLATLLRRGPGARAPRGQGDREASERSAVKRARTMIRRWCVQNKVDRGLTLTCRPEEMVYDIASAWALIATFRRAMAEKGQDCFLIVPELCENGQYHFHGAIPGWVDVKVLEECWGLGWVMIRKPKVPKGTSARQRSRILAGYLSKYLGKDFGTDATGQDRASGPSGASASKVAPTEFNGKRYTTSRGFAVRKVNARSTSMYEAYRAACNLLGCSSIEMVWCSNELDDWHGPPTSVWHAC